MNLFRLVAVLMLVAAVVCFGLYVFTGEQRYRRWGLRIVKWTVLVVLGLFAVLVVERLVH